MADWGKQEVELAVADYLSMLSDELAGVPVNKKRHREALMPLLAGRSAGSVEFKHQNISAVLALMGKPFIRGYKPRYNIQRILADTVAAQLERRPELELLFEAFALSAEVATGHPDFGKMLVPPPAPRDIVREPMPAYARGPVKTDFIAREQANTALGTKGEALVLGYERWRLAQAGQGHLADRVEWVAAGDDAAGFDILSFEADGSDRYIEVKTTKLTRETPIYFSRNEYAFSQQHRSRYNLYRVFDAAAKPRFFTRGGSFDDFCAKEPVTYSGIFT